MAEGANLAANSLSCQRQPLRAWAKRCATFLWLIGTVARLGSAACGVAI